MIEKKNKYYCDYKYCSCPNKAIPPIKKDYLWSKSQRRLHKKCSFLVMSENDIVINPKNLE
tara:strand:+ start:241 stop:423 length:183 start_codon:yes stop_codon:yes gene_type:complete